MLTYCKTARKSPTQTSQVALRNMLVCVPFLLCACLVHAHSALAHSVTQPEVELCAQQGSFLHHSVSVFWSTKSSRRALNTRSIFWVSLLWKRGLTFRVSPVYFAPQNVWKTVIFGQRKKIPCFLLFLSGKGCCNAYNPESHLYASWMSQMLVRGWQSGAGCTAEVRPLTTE